MLWVSGAESWGPLYFEHLYYSLERLADIFGEPLDEAPSVAMKLLKTSLKLGTVESHTVSCAWRCWHQNHSKHLEVNRSSTQCCVLIPSTYHVTYQHRDCDNNVAKKNEKRHMKHIKKRITWELLFHPTSAHAKRIPAICSYNLKWPMYQCIAEMT